MIRKSFQVEFYDFIQFDFSFPSSFLLQIYLTEFYHDIIRVILTCSINDEITLHKFFDGLA